MTSVLICAGYPDSGLTSDLEGVVVQSMERFTGWLHALNPVPGDDCHLDDLKPTSMDLHATRPDYTLASQMC